jgi:ADP-ribose pyrophosphatase YjhB (NUDIX family)
VAARLARPEQRPLSRAARSAPRRARDAATRALLRAGFPLLKLWWRLTHPTLEGVYVAVWHGERVLLIRNSYRQVFSFPSGRRARQEAPVLAAVRELREEVGLAVAPEALVHVEELVLETRLVTDHVHLFELRLEEEPVIAIDEREVVWAAFEPPERARERALLPVVARYLAGRR